MATGRRARVAASVVIGVPALVVVVVLAQRHGRPETFVSWPVVGVAALATAVALLGVWTRRSGSIVVGMVAALVPAAVLVYVIPVAAPLAGVAVGLALLGGLAIYAGGFASSLATTSALLLLVLTVVQDPAVECRARGVSTSSGPWWVTTPDHTFASGSGGPGNDASGVVQVGHDVYHYACRDGRLVDFGRRSGENLVG